MLFEAGTDKPEGVVVTGVIVDADSVRFMVEVPPELSLTFKVNGEATAEVGVPVISPVVVIVRPAGRLPALMVNT